MTWKRRLRPRALPTQTRVSNWFNLYIEFSWLHLSFPSIDQTWNSLSKTYYHKILIKYQTIIRIYNTSSVKSTSRFTQIDLKNKKNRFVEFAIDETDFFGCTNSIKKLQFTQSNSCFKLNASNESRIMICREKNTLFLEHSIGVNIKYTWLNITCNASVTR